MNRRRYTPRKGSETVPIKNPTASTFARTRTVTNTNTNTNVYTNPSVNTNTNTSTATSINPNPNINQDYITVVDCETKYKNRPIQNNWGKYGAGRSDLENSNDEDESYKTKDFSFLLKYASSDCAHFEFRSEKDWKKESHSIPTSDAFNLDLNVLTNGLACVPFYQRIGLDESELTIEDKARFDEAAQRHWKVYNPIKENFLKKYSLQSENSQSCINELINKINESTLEELLETKFNVNVENERDGLTIKKDNSIEKNLKSIQVLKRNDQEKKETSTSSLSETKNKTSNTLNAIFTDDDNLEEWLDNMLDD